ncbi:MAG: multidrug ABC transporter ATP-binding protein [Gracilibacter sp. BRH_c7a]|nr:MAG: multidrug ABC transporter ATP-binding protein [Gracilibacter sp. BRH_c7a]
MTVLLKTDNLNKGFFRNKALANLNLEIEKGKVYGLLGPNGSGKTTFFKIAAGLYKPSSGSMLIDGRHVGVETRKITAFMPTEDFLFKWMKIKMLLNFYADMYEDFNIDQARDFLEQMELKEDMKVKNLSTGMKARLKLVVTMARKASIYLLDEPLNGIDIISRDKIMKVIVSSLHENCTVIVSSHFVSELEALMDEVIFLDKGSVVLAGNSEQFRLERKCSIEELYKEVYHA